MGAKIYPFITENWKIDGGICFGVVAKSTWSKLISPDENNLIEVSNRCLMIESGVKKILIDTGMGDKLDSKVYSYFHKKDSKSISESISELGYNSDDITDVIFTHLHWDHVGGATYLNANGETELCCKNATHWCSKTGWDWALNPSPREKKAFYKEDLLPLLESGKLRFIESDGPFDQNIYLSIKNGHTIGQLIPSISTKKGLVVFAADFIPSKAHIPIPYTPGQDIQPLITMDEKIQFFSSIANKDVTILFQHDPANECCKILKTEKGFEATISFTWEN